MRTLAAATALWCLAAEAGAPLVPCDRPPLSVDTFLGYSAKYKQFAVRRQVFFALCSEGRPMPKLVVPQPTERRPDGPPPPDFTCAAFCTARGTPCAQGPNAPKPFVYFERGKGGFTHRYEAAGCDERLIETGPLALKKTLRVPPEQLSPATVGCYCQEFRQAHAFTGLAHEQTLTFVEVYQSDGTPKRTFLENPGQLPALTQLRQDLPALNAARPTIEREVAAPDAWAGHFKNGGFTVPPPTGKHPGGKCVATFDPGTVDTNEGNGPPRRQVDVGVTTPAGAKSIFSGELFSQKVSFNAWWLPVKPAVLVGVLSAPDNEDEATGRYDFAQLVLVPAAAMTGCD